MYGILLKTFLIILLCGFTFVSTQSVHKYEVIIDHLDLPKRDGIFDYGTIRVTKPNRTTYMIDGNFKILIPFTDEIHGTFDVFQLQGNEYRLVYKKQLDKLCSQFRDEKTLMPMYIKYTSFETPIVCPLKVDDYSINEFIIPSDYMPIEPPKGEKYRVDCTYSLNGEVLTHFKIYANIRKLPLGSR